MVADTGQRDIGRRLAPIGIGGLSRNRCACRLLLRAVICRRPAIAGHARGLFGDGGLHVVVGGEEPTQFGRQPEIAHSGAFRHGRSETRDSRILTVEHHGARRRFGDTLQQTRGVVDLAEPVELIAHHVEQQREPRLHLLHEFHRIRLVKLKHGHVGVQPAAQRHFGQQRRDDAAREVGAGRIGEHLESQRLQHRGDHARRGGLAVRARHQHHAIRQVGERAGEETRVDLFDDLARERAAAVPQQPRGAAYGFADQRRSERGPWTRRIRLPAQRLAPCFTRCFTRLGSVFLTHRHTP